MGIPILTVDSALAFDKLMIDNLFSVCNVGAVLSRQHSERERSLTTTTPPSIIISSKARAKAGASLRLLNLPHGPWEQEQACSGIPSSSSSSSWQRRHTQPRRCPQDLRKTFFDFSFISCVFITGPTRPIIFACVFHWALLQGD